MRHCKVFGHCPAGRYPIIRSRATGADREDLLPVQKRPFFQSKELDFESGYMGFLSGTRTIRTVYSRTFRVYFLIGAYNYPHSIFICRFSSGCFDCNARRRERKRIEGRALGTARRFRRRAVPSVCEVSFLFAVIFSGIFSIRIMLSAFRCGQYVKSIFTGMFTMSFILIPFLSAINFIEL